MSAILPRSQKKKNPEKLSHSSKEANKGKKSFQGTGGVQRSSGRKQEVQTLQSHPWSGFVEKLLSPLPPDIRYNIQRALGGFAEAVGKMFPNQNTEMTSNLFADRGISFSSWTEDQQGTEAPEKRFSAGRFARLLKVDELDIYIHGDFETEEEGVELATETVLIDAGKGKQYEQINKILESRYNPIPPTRRMLLPIIAFTTNKYLNLNHSHRHNTLLVLSKMH